MRALRGRTPDNAGMGGGEGTVAFRLWPPVAMGGPLLLAWGAIGLEERFLRKRFGATYDDYTRRVRRWL